jgi:hypothetical protein
MHIDATTPIAQLRPYKRFIAEAKVNNAWKTALPGASIAAIEQLVGGFLDQGSTQVDMGALIDKIVGSNPADKARIKNMIERDFKPEQIHLFVHSSQEDRQQLARSWQKPLSDQLKESATQTNNVAHVATTVGVVGGAIGCLLFMGAGMMANDGSITETGRILLGVLSDPPIGTDGSDLARPNGDSVIASGAAISFGAALLSLCLKSTLAFASEILKDDPQAGLKKTRLDLNDRILGAFSRAGSEGFTTSTGVVAREHAETELKTVPDSHIPLLTHFSPSELITFLVANEGARENMMLSHPPTSEQKIETVRALYSSKMRRSWETARQSLTAWEGAFARAPGLTLKSTMASLREARNARIAQANASIEPRLASPKLR